METINQKVRHVTSARQTRTHTCHWPDCGEQVPPAMWGCRMHWLALPKSIRVRIWGAYRSGQEERMDPSEEYVAAARAAQEWISERS